MIVRRRRGLVLIEMYPEEFRETVEWLELLDPDDVATAEWRAWLDRVSPTEDA